MRVSFHHSSGYVSSTLQIIRGHLVLLLTCKAVVQPIRLTFKRTELAITKLIHSGLKNVVVWNTYAIKRAY